MVKLFIATSVSDLSHIQADFIIHLIIKEEVDKLFSFTCIVCFWTQ
jgi:hypothetical protein